jgi:hypothetical protein
VQIAAGNIPECAMHVTRDGDVGPLASFQPEVACDCYFEANVPGGDGLAPAGCETCENATGPELADEEANPACPTSTPYCRYGFCEVK